MISLIMMQSFNLFILSSLALTTASDNIPFATYPCVLGGFPSCSTDSTCAPTQTCGGLCVTSAVLPPVVPCTVGNDAPCPTNNICTPTQVCPTETNAPCGGQCIATTNAPQPPLPTIPCLIGGSNCPSDSFCYQTEVCSGTCVFTPPLVTATPTPTVTPTPASTSITPTPTPTLSDFHGGYNGRCPKKHRCGDRYHGKCSKKQKCGNDVEAAPVTTSSCTLQQSTLQYHHY